MTADLEKPRGLYHRYAKFSQSVNRWQSLPLLIIRLYFGYQTAQAGIRHLETFQLTAARFDYWHIPFPSASVAVLSSIEVVCGLMLYLGFFARLASVPLMINFFVTMLVVNLSAADFSLHQMLANIWNDQDYILQDSGFPYLMASMSIFFFGPGWVSVDGFIRFWAERNAEPARLG